MVKDKKQEIIDVLERHAPDLVLDTDTTMLDYIVGILLDQDSDANPDSLQELVAPFVDGDYTVVAKILQEIIPHSGDACQSDLLDQVRRLDGVNDLADNDKAPTDGHETSDGDEENHEKHSKTKRETRAQRKANKQRRKKDLAVNVPSSDKEREEIPVEDDLSAWNECQEQSLTWGGRGHGGRGEYAGAVNHIKSNIHLSNVTIALPNGKELLSNTSMDIQKGHRFGLIGRNGLGKSFLLQRLAKKSIPGMPHDMRVLLVQQQLAGSNETPLQVLQKADVHRVRLLQEQEELEALLETSDDLSQMEITDTAERLGAIAEELDTMDSDRAEERALAILRGLQFTPEMLDAPTHNLSGGWRMRLSLARALFVQSDLLLLDEVSNHIDLAGLDWLIQYLRKDRERTMIIVSHDRSFLDAVCTDIIHMNHQVLKYHPGNFSEFERQQEEKSAREAQILDAAERQRNKAEAFVKKQEAMARSKSADPNKQRQAKMIKDKKLDRIGNYREDGKRYKLNSWKKLDEKSLRLAQKVTIEVDEPIIKMHFPNPTWPIGIGPDDAIVRMEKFSFGYSESGNMILKRNTLNLSRGSKVAVVGKNGSGKSTLMRLFAQEIKPTDYCSSGEFWHHPNIRIGHMTQFSVEELEQYKHQTVVEYAEEKLRSCKASASIVAKASGNIRQYLGAFGLGGKHAMQPIGKLSGGERMRLCFATVLAEEPHLLLLDESTNHCDYETLDSMSKALNEYQGSVLMVSHNQGFLSGFCEELWVLKEGHIAVNHSDTNTFDELFSDYRSAATGSSSELEATRRQQRVHMAKRAEVQRANAKQKTALV